MKLWFYLGNEGCYRRFGETLIWRDFREEFEERYYSWSHRKKKEQEFLDLR
jgi:hypothetical protein